MKLWIKQTLVLFFAILFLLNCKKESEDSNPVLPTVSTSVISSVTETSASSGGDVTDEGSNSVTVKGVCWSTNNNPTTTDSKTTDGLGLGSFASEMPDLLSNTTYFVRAYATNSEGTAYGNERSFTTGVEIVVTTPTVTTTDVSAITSSSATSGGDVPDDGNATVTERGVCWSTSPNPTTSDNKLVDPVPFIFRNFQSFVLGLTPNTTYYVRAYAINSVGTGYGNELSFTTE